MHTLPTHIIELVEASHGRIAQRARAMALSFDEEIVAVAPSLLDLFPRDDVGHRRTEIAFVAFVVENLRTEQLVVLLEHMGGRGMLRAVRPHEIEAIGKVLLLVLRHFDDAFDAETRHAWATAFVWTLSTLRRGAAHVRLAHAG